MQSRLHGQGIEGGLFAGERRYERTDTDVEAARRCFWMMIYTILIKCKKRAVSDGGCMSNK